MHIGANLIVNESTPSIIDIAVGPKSEHVESLFQGEHTHIPLTTAYPANSGVMPEFYRRFPDVFVTLAAAASVTRTIRLGTGVALVAEHNSFHLAKATATLDRPSGGRLELGVGYGWNPPELANNGVPWAERRAVFHRTSHRPEATVDRGGGRAPAAIMDRSPSHGSGPSRSRSPIRRS